MGRIASDPETRVLANNKVVTLVVSVGDRYQKNGTKVERRQLVPVQVWNKLAETSAELHKDQGVIVEVRIGAREYEGRLYVDINAICIEYDDIRF